MAWGREDEELHLQGPQGYTSVYNDFSVHLGRDFFLSYIFLFLYIALQFQGIALLRL